MDIYVQIYAFMGKGKRMPIYFYGTKEKPYGCFSNFSRHGFELDGYWWPTSEHYFQAQKFVGTTYADEIRLARTPKDAAMLGRKRTYPLRPDWEVVKDDIMLRGVLRKFETHADLRTLLLESGDEEIIENAPGDYYWGCGADGSGKNMLGQTLMTIRILLRDRIEQKNDVPVENNRETDDGKSSSDIAQ